MSPETPREAWRPVDWPAQAEHGRDEAARHPWDLLESGSEPAHARHGRFYRDPKVLQGPRERGALPISLGGAA